LSNFYSQIGQDQFVINQLKGLRDGTFLDIGGHDPIHLSNTYYLETQLNWRGIAIDIEPHYAPAWANLRPRSKFIVQNALEVDWEKVLSENNMPNVIDYLNVDLDPPQVTMQAMFRLPFDKVTFKVITFETDYYRDQSTQQPSRDFLTARGYNLIEAVNNQDDWYVHSSVMV
jgi:hypothetical protein